MILTSISRFVRHTLQPTAALVALLMPNGRSHAEVLASTNGDFSNANPTANALPSGLGQAGFHYGYYTGTNATTEGGGVTFSTAGMNPAGAFGWTGSAGGSTPGHNPFIGFHPGVDGTSVVWRYTVGDANGEPAYTGAVRIVGSFWDLNSGQTSGFITVDGSVVFPKTVVNGPVPFDFEVSVAPSSKIDFGATVDGDGGSSDQTGFVAQIVTGDTAVPTGLVANAYNSPHEYAGAGEQGVRRTCFAMVSDGKVSGVDETTFDTAPGTGYPYQFAGLLYLENAGSGKATRFDSVRIDVTTGADFAELPRLFLLRHNSDPNTSNPAADERYALLPVTGVRTAANSAGQPYYTFDLSGLTANERTGYGFAVVGPGAYQGTSIAVSEVSATAVRVPDTGVIAAQPFWVNYGGHRYARTLVQGTWEQCEAEAASYGGHLVAINDAAENEFLIQTFGYTDELFIGLRQNLSSPSYSEPAGGFEWVNGDAYPGAFTNWHGPAFGGTEPNHAYGAGEDYVVLGYFQTPTGTWADVKNAGFPETSNYRGIIELPTPGAETQFRGQVLATANIYGAGQANTTPTANEAGTGGTAPLFAELPAGAGVVTFSSVTGLIHVGPTGALQNIIPDGTTNYSTTIAAASGFNGHAGIVNGTGGGFLTGVFVDADGAAAPLPAALDFSSGARGQDFAFLAPKLNQPFFIGDGLAGKGTGAMQQFIVPAGATRLYLGIADAYDGTPFHNAAGSGAYQDNSGAFNVRLSVATNIGPIITETEFPALDPMTNTAQFSTPAGGAGPYNWEILSGNFPPHLLLNPDGSIVLSGNPEVNGDYTFTVRVNDVNGLHSDKEFTVSIHNSVPAGAGIVAWWPGDDAVADIIGGHHGSLKNSQFDSFGAGKVGRGFAFDGTNDVVQVADADALDLTGDLTIEAWVNATATSNERTIVSKRSGDNNDVTYTLFLRNGVPYFTSRVAGGSFREASPGVILPAGLNHVAVTLAGSTLKMFINGAELLNTSTYDGVRPTTAGPLTIGGTITDANPASNPDGCFAGVIDELALYTRALTNAEITAIYDAGVGGKARYDAARDFSATENPNGVWTYGSIPAGATTIPPTLAKLPNNTPDLPPIVGWSGPSYITYNPSANFVVVPSGGTQYDWAPQQFAWGPSPNSDYAVLRWTAPAAGRYAVSANFFGCDTRPTTADTHVFHNGAALFGGALGTYPAEGYINSYRGDGLATTQSITAQTGDRVDFVLGAGNNGFFYDSSGAFISVVYLGTALEIVETEFPPEPTDATPWKLTATGGTGNYSFAITAGAMPSHIDLATDGTISRVPDVTPVIGHYDFTVTVSDGQQTAQRAFSIAVAEEVPLPGNPLAWFPGELHAHDIVAGINATSNSATFGPGKVGRAFVFNGVDQSIEAASGILNRLPLTIEAWVKPEVRTDGTAADLFPANIVCNDKQNFGGVGIGANVFASGSSLWIELQTTDPADAHHRVPGVTLTAGQWTHVALVLTPGNAKTYVNGELKESFDYSEGAADGDTVLRIGRHNNDAGFGTRRFFKGAIDEVTIYENALSASQILGIYNADSIGKARDDAARDFSAITNAAGQRWQYGAMNAGASPDVNTFTRYAEIAPENVIRAWRTAGTVDPNVVKNVGATPYFYWQPGRLSAHPGNAGSGTSGKFSVVRWTAPAAGTYAVASTFIGLNGASEQATSTTVHIRHNATEVANGSVSEYNVDHPFSATINASAGDTVDFIVGPNGNGDFDATGLNPTLVLLAPGPQFTSADFPVTSDSLNVSGSLAIEGGTGPFTFTLVAGTLPPGLTLRPNGTVLGTLTANGTFDFTIKVTDSLGRAAQRAFSVVVGQVPPPPPITPADSLTLTANGKAVKAGSTVRQDSKFVFTAMQLSDAYAAGLRLRVQYSSTPEVDASWQDVPEPVLSRKKDGATKWTLTTGQLPAGQNLHFRTLTSGDAYSSSPGPKVEGIVTPLGPITIQATAVLEVTLTVKSDSDSTGATVHPDEIITYTMKVKNVGSAPAAGLVYGLPIPKNTELDGLPSGNDGGIVSGAPDLINYGKVTKVQWDYGAIGSLAPGASVTSTVNVELKRDLAFHTIITAKGAFAKYQGKLDEPLTTVLKTELLAPVTITLKSYEDPYASDSNKVPMGIIYRGGWIPYLMTVRNDAASDLRDAKAIVRVPPGSRVLCFASKSGSDFDGVIESFNPQESLNPTLNRWEFGQPQTITWNLGTIPPSVTRKMIYYLEVQHDVPPTILVNDVYVTNQIVTRYNVSYTPQIGGTLSVYDGPEPRQHLLVTAEDYIDPPIIGIEKSAVGDTVFRAQTVEGDETFRGDVVGVHEGNSIVYRVHFHNNGNGTAIRARINDRIAAGMTFQGFCKISRTGNEADEQELPFNAFRFYDKKGKLISGEPWFDDGDGIYEQGETFTDVDRDGRYTPQGDIRKAEWILFELGDLAPGANGYVRYQCAAAAAAGTLIKSDGYALVTESLQQAIRGTPRTTYARVVKGLSFDKNIVGSTTAIAPFDEPDHPEKSEVTYTITVRNTGDLKATPVNISMPIPAGMTYVDSSIVDDFGQPIATTPKLLPAGKPTRTVVFSPQLAPDRYLKVRIRCRALPSVQLPADLKRLDSAVVPQVAVGGTYDPQQALSARERLATRDAVIKKFTVASTSVSTNTRFLETNRAELWGFKSAPLTQESRKNIVYLMVAGNSGNTAARNVELAFQIPYGTEFVSASPAAKPDKKGIIRWKIGDLQPHTAHGFYLEVNIAYLDSGVVKDNSCVITCDNFPEIIPGVTRTTVRQRPFHAGLWEWFTNSVAPLGINLKGPGNSHLQEELRTLSETSRFHTSQNANVIWTKSGHGIIPNGGGEVVVIGSSGSLTGGTAIVGGQGTIVHGGTGASITASGIGNLSGATLIDLVNQTRNRNDSGAPNVFVCGNGRLISRTGDQLIDNDTGSVISIVQAKAGPGLVAAGGGNMVAAGGGNMVAAGGLNMVAAGGLNLVAAGGLNLVAAGGGNIVAAGGGNMVAAGGLNLVAAGGGNVLSHNGGALVAAGGGNLIGQDGASLVGNNGNSLVGNSGNTLVGNSGNTLIGTDGGSLIGEDGASLIGQDGGSLVAAGAGN